MSRVISRATLRSLRSRAGPRAVILRAAVLAAGWWILTEGARAGLVFGAFAVVVALLASIVLPSPPPPAWHPAGLLRFAWIFLVGSIRGGVDVARRALTPRLAIAPAVQEYTLRLPEGPARNLLLGTLSLMPGTLPITCDGERLAVHVLAPHRAFVDELAALEAAIARATGQRLEVDRA